MFTAQLCAQGACKQAEIIKAFGVSKSSVLRSVNKYREEGIEGFYKSRRARGARVMTPEVVQQAQQLFAEGHSKAEVAREVDIPVLVHRFYVSCDPRCNSVDYLML